MGRLFGDHGATVIAVGIACSTFGYCSIAIAGGARVLQTMGADGVFFRATGRVDARTRAPQVALAVLGGWRSEEHTSELQSLMRISYAVFCLKKKMNKPKA